MMQSFYFQSSADKGWNRVRLLVLAFSMDPPLPFYQWLGRPGWYRQLMAANVTITWLPSGHWWLLNDMTAQFPAFCLKLAVNERVLFVVLKLSLPCKNEKCKNMKKVEKDCDDIFNIQDPVWTVLRSILKIFCLMPFWDHLTESDFPKIFAFGWRSNG